MRITSWFPVFSVLNGLNERTVKLIFFIILWGILHEGKLHLWEILQWNYRCKTSWFPTSSVLYGLNERILKLILFISLWGILHEGKFHLRLFRWIYMCLNSWFLIYRVLKLIFFIILCGILQEGKLYFRC